MLILTRRRGESLVFFLADGQEIVVDFRRCRAGQVQVAIDAPAEVGIVRGEIVDQREPIAG